MSTTLLIYADIQIYTLPFFILITLKKSTHLYFLDSHIVKNQEQFLSIRYFL